MKYLLPLLVLVVTLYSNSSFAGVKVLCDSDETKLNSQLQTFSSAITVSQPTIAMASEGISYAKGNALEYERTTPIVTKICVTVKY